MRVFWLRMTDKEFDEAAAGTFRQERLIAGKACKPAWTSVTISSWLAGSALSAAGAAVIFLAIGHRSFPAT
jgi:hypothetical protein